MMNDDNVNPYLCMTQLELNGMMEMRAKKKLSTQGECIQAVSEASWNNYDDNNYPYYCMTQLQLKGKLEISVQKKYYDCSIPSRYLMFFKKI